MPGRNSSVGLALVSVLLMGCASPQSQPARPLEPGDVVRIDTDRGRVTGRITEVESTRLQLQTQRIGPTDLVSADEIRNIDRRTGSHAGIGAIIGGAAGLLGAAIYLGSCGENECLNSAINTSATVVLGLGGTLIGTLVGWMIPRWQDVEW